MHVSVESVKLNEELEHMASSDAPEIIEIIDVSDAVETINANESIELPMDPSQTTDNIHTPTNDEQLESRSLTDDNVKPLKMLAQICVNELDDIRRRNSIFVDSEPVIENGVCGSRGFNAIDTVAYEENNNKVNVIGSDSNELKQISERCDRKRSRKSDHPRKKIQNRHFAEQDIFDDMPNVTAPTIVDSEMDRRHVVEVEQITIDTHRNYIEPLFIDVEAIADHVEATADHVEATVADMDIRIEIESPKHDIEASQNDTESSDIEIIETSECEESKDDVERSKTPTSDIEMIEIDSADENLDCELELIEVPEEIDIRQSITLDDANESIEQSSESFVYNPDSLRMLCRKTLDKQSVIVTYDVPSLKCLCEHALALAGMNVIPTCYITDNESNSYHVVNVDGESGDVILCLDSEFDETELANLFNGTGNSSFSETIVHTENTLTEQATEVCEETAETVSLIEQCVALQNILQSPTYDRVEEIDTDCQSVNSMDRRSNEYFVDDIHHMTECQETEIPFMPSVLTAKKRLQAKYVNPMSIYKMLVVHRTLKKYVIYMRQLARKKCLMRRKLKVKLQQLAEKRMRAVYKPQPIMARRRSMRLVEKQKELDASRRRFDPFLMEYVAEREKVYSREKIKDKPKKVDKVRGASMEKDGRNDKPVKSLKIKLIVPNRADSEHSDQSEKAEKIDKRCEQPEKTERTCEKADKNERKFDKVEKVLKTIISMKDLSVKNIETIKIVKTPEAIKEKSQKNIEAKPTVKAMKALDVNKVKSMTFSVSVNKEKTSKADNIERKKKRNKPPNKEDTPKTEKLNQRTNGEKIRKDGKAKATSTNPTKSTQPKRPAEPKRTPKPPEPPQVEKPPTKPDQALDSFDLMELIARRKALKQKLSSADTKPIVPPKPKASDEYRYDEDRQIDQMLNSFINGGVDRRIEHFNRPHSRNSEPRTGLKRPMSPDVMASTAAQQRQAMRPAKIQKRSYSVSSRDIYEGERRRYNYMDSFNRHMQQYNFNAMVSQKRRQSLAHDTMETPTNQPVKRTISLEKYIAQRPALAKQRANQTPNADPVRRSTSPHRAKMLDIGCPAPKRFLADQDMRICPLKFRDFDIQQFAPIPRLSPPIVPIVEPRRVISPLRINLETMRVSPAMASSPNIADPRLRDAKSQVNLVTSTQTPLNTIQLKLPTPPSSRSPQDIPKHTHTRTLP